VCKQTDAAADTLQELTAKAGVKAVCDFVGAGVTTELAAGLIPPVGHIVVVGRGHGAFEFKDRALLYGATMSTTFTVSKWELMQLVALSEKGAIEPHIAKYSPSEVQSAFDKLRNGEIVGKAVVIPDGHQ